MKRTFIFVIAFLSQLSSYTQQQENISIGKKEGFYSTLLKENRKLWIYTPNLTSQGADTSKRYPVLYLLDGDAHFYATVGIIQQLSQANGNGVLPEMIVVGIENTNRLRDLTPSSDHTKPNPFVEFLSKELIPYIDSHYPTAPYKLLSGHSLGGLTAIDILTNHTTLFNAVIAIDPSMWYQNEAFLTQTLHQLPQKSMQGKRLFIGTANTMPAGMTLSALSKDRSAETQHIRSIFKLDAFLKKNRNGLLYAEKYYDKDRHNTVPLASLYDGLRFIFDYYFLDITPKEFSDTTARLAAKLQSHYLRVSEKMGYKNAAPETLINYLAYDALGKKQYTRAKSFFELNTNWYPSSANVYDSYGDYFAAIRDTAHAIEKYKKALSIKDNPETKDKLALLLKKASDNSLPKNLDQYAGLYVLETFNIPVELVIREGSLWAKVPGQPDDELQYLSENIFTVKGKQGYRITFHMNENKTTGFTSVQPNGTFKANRKQ